MAVLACGVGHTQGAIVNWDGGGDGSNWSSANNWNPNGSPNSTTDVVFDNSSTNVPATIIVSGNAYAARSITLSRDTDLTLDQTSNGSSKGATLTLGNATSTTLISVTAAGNLTITNGTSNGPLVLIDGGTGSFDVSGTGRLIIEANIQETGGAKTIAKTGIGTLTLSGSNTFTGGVALKNGTLNINSTTALGNGTFAIGDTTGSTAVTINNTSGAALTNANNNAQTWYQNFTFTGSNDLNLGTGAVTLAGNRTVTISAGNLTAGGAIGDGGSAYGITKAGAGTLVLTGNSTFTGLTTISQGALKLGAPGSGGNTPLGTVANGTVVAVGGALDLNGHTLSAAEALSLSGTGVSSTGALTNSGAASTYSGVVTLQSDASVGGSGNITLSGKVTGAANLTKVGANALTLSNSSNDCNGQLTINAGTLKLAAASTNNLNSTSQITLTGGATLDVTGLTSSTLVLNQNLLATGSGTATFTGTLNTGSKTVDASGITGTGNLSISSGLTLNGGKIITVGNTVAPVTVGGTLDLSGTNTFDVTGMATTQGIYKLLSYGSTAGAGSFTTTGLDSSYTLVKDTTNKVYQLQHKADESLTSLAAFRMMNNSTATAQTLGQLNNTAPSQSAALNVGLSVSGTGLTFSSLSPGNGTTIAAGANSTVTATVASGATTGNISVALTNADSSAVTTSVTGFGTISVLADRVITASNVDYGLVHVGASVSGNTTLTSTGADDANTRVQLPNGTSGGWSVTGGNASLIFNGSTSDTRALGGTLSTAGTFTGSSALSLTPGTEAGVVGRVQTPVAVGFTYSAQVFSGNATWAGGGGSYGTGGNWTDDTTASIHAAPGTFASFGNTDKATFSGAGGTVSLNGTSPSLKNLTFGGANAYTLAQGTSGTVTLDNGTSAATITATGTHSITAPVALNSNVTVSLAGSSDKLNVSGGLSGSGKSLTLTGSGTLTLSGTLGYSGATAVNGGTLGLAGSPSTSGITVAASATLAVGGAGSIGSLTLASPSALTLSSGGILGCEINGQNATNYDQIIFSGGTTASTSGTLNVTFINGFDYTQFAVGTQIDLFSLSGPGMKFSAVNIQTPNNSGLAWDTSDLVTGGGHFIKVSTAGVPEPASIALGALAVVPAGLALLRRRRKNREKR